jgi:hypothetical protein
MANCRPRSIAVSAFVGGLLSRPCGISPPLPKIPQCVFTACRPADYLSGPYIEGRSEAVPNGTPDVRTAARRFMKVFAPSPSAAATRQFGFTFSLRGSMRALGL